MRPPVQSRLSIDPIAQLQKVGKQRTSRGQGQHPIGEVLRHAALPTSHSGQAQLVPMFTFRQNMLGSIPNTQTTENAVLMPGHALAPMETAQAEKARAQSAPATDSQLLSPC